PPQLLPMIKQMLADFKAKRRDRMEVWRQIKGKPVGVKYLAVYDSTGEYIGTVELVQDFSEALIHFADKN
ncbi:MAG: PAS domain-containing protein, partial [Selenomonadaceae bacterium]|nr:PAS domain-containing protein [Selenomonadaceae bacterium]